MPIPVSGASWWGSLLWLVGLTAAAFGIAWVSGTRLRIRKGPYIPLLLLVTAGLTIGYVAWLGVGVGDLVTARWGWGLLAAVVAGVALIAPVRRQPVDRPLHGRRRTLAMLWEGGFYGVAEGVLLSALPPFMLWQMVHSLGWDGAGGAIARWTLPVIGSAAVVVIHHLGYWSCRNRILIPITLGLTVLTVGFLVTGSWIVPALGHVFLHVSLIAHGAEMPPHDRPAGPPQPEELVVPRAA